MRADTDGREETVSQRRIRIITLDGHVLVGTWFVPVAAQISTAVVVVCGAGIPAKYYSRLAQYLAQRGAAVLTFDYRGIGLSRSDKLRGFNAGMEHWAGQDFVAALTESRAAYSTLPISVVAHSVGSLFVGAAPDCAFLSKIVFLGPHTGYWGDYAPRWRWPLFFIWHAFVPSVAKIVGYFPGRFLHLGDDLPLQVALDWADRRQPELVTRPHDAARFSHLLSRFVNCKARTLCLSISDDPFAPPEAARRLLALYPSVISDQEIITPANLGLRRLGHFGFIRRRSGEFFSRRVAAWLIPAARGPEKNEADRCV